MKNEGRMTKHKDPSFEQAAIWTPAANFGNCARGGYSGARDGAFAEGFAAAGAEEFVEFARWQHE
jgi:hypothetical protein